MSLLDEAMEKCVMIDKTTVPDGIGGYDTVYVEGAEFDAYHDIFKRIRDGKVFRVTSDGDDVFTPQSATLDMRQCTCEEFKIR